MPAERLGQMLVDMGFLDRERVEAALDRQRETGKRLGRQLVDDGVLTEERLVSALARHLNIAAIDPLRTPVHEKVLELFPLEFAYEHCVIPIARRKEGVQEILFVATADPLNDDAVQAIQKRLGPGVNVGWMIAGELEMTASLRHHYGPNPNDPEPPPPPKTMAPEELPFADADLVDTSIADDLSLEVVSGGASDSSEKLPVTFGPYTLKERLGAGGMAEIFLATTRGIEGFESTLVIKRMQRSLAQKEEFRRLFIGEANLCVGLRHPNIVQVYHLGEVAETCYISMKYVEGPDLKKILTECRKQRKTVPIEIALYVLSELLKGLHYCHEACDREGEPLKIIHRDVSPSNVLISQHGDIKLGDFGVAKATTTEQTAAGIVKGKFGYMAPEQLMGEPLDRRADIFACGIVLHEILTGRPLFGGDDCDIASVERLLDADITEPLRHYRSDVPTEVEAVIEKALTLDPNERFQTAAEFRKALPTVGEGQQLASFVTELKRAGQPKPSASGRIRAPSYPTPNESFVPNGKPTKRKSGALVILAAILFIGGIALMVASTKDTQQNRIVPFTPTPTDEILPGIFDETAPEGFAYLAHDTTLFQEARADTKGVDVEVGQPVQMILRVDGHILVVVPPRGPTGFVMEDKLSVQKPMGAHVRAVVQTVCPNRNSCPNSVQRLKAMGEDCLQLKAVDRCLSLVGATKMICAERCRSDQ